MLFFAVTINLVNLYTLRRHVYNQSCAFRGQMPPSRQRCHCHGLALYGSSVALLFAIVERRRRSRCGGNWRVLLLLLRVRSLSVRQNCYTKINWIILTLHRSALETAAAAAAEAFVMCTLLEHPMTVCRMAVDSVPSAGIYCIGVRSRQTSQFGAYRKTRWIVQ